MKRFLFAGVCVFTLLLFIGHSHVPHALAQEKEMPTETRNFMQAKLTHAQKILEGLSLENYDTVVKHAQELSLLSLESQWNVLRTQKYVDQSAEFRHAIERLVEAARSKQVDATALAYMDVTLKCVHCHKYVRSGPDGAKEAIGSNAGR